jgi:hypothetical protein
MGPLARDDRIMDDWTGAGLLAPIGLHWAINALGYVAALVVTRWRGGT